MGWLARVLVPSAALSFVGCAAIANLGDATTTTDEQTDAKAGSASGTSGTSGTSGSSGTSGTSGTSGDSGTSGTSGDSGTTMDAAADTAPACTKTQNGDACNASSECCSGACATNHSCKDSCKKIGNTCSLGSSDCCIGAYCSAASISRCAACHNDGTSPEVDNVFGQNVVVTDSCCSRHVDNQGKCNP